MKRHTVGIKCRVFKVEVKFSLLDWRKSYLNKSKLAGILDRIIGIVQHCGSDLMFI